MKKRAARVMASYVGERIKLDDLTSSRPLLQILDGRGALSQTELARAAGLSTGACNLHVQRLEHEGLIRRAEEVRKGRGRPTVKWALAGPGNYCITLVFDTPFLLASLMDFDGVVAGRQQDDLSAVTSQRALLAILNDRLADFSALVQSRKGVIRQVLVAVPGLLDPDSAAVKMAVNLPVLNGLDLRGHIEEQLGLSCYVGSLGLAFYFGEAEYLSPDVSSMVLHWDLGVGAVFGRGRRLQTLCAPPDSGRRMIAELGHVRIVREGRSCRCGNQGCLEAYVGGWALMEELKLTQGRLDDLLCLVEKGDKQALAAAKRAARILGRNLAWPLQVMHTRKIVVSGPMAPVFHRVRDGFRRGLAETFTPDEITRLAPEASPDPAGRMERGAFLLARRLFLYPEEYGQLPRPAADLG